MCVFVSPLYNPGSSESILGRPRTLSRLTVVRVSVIREGRGWWCGLHRCIPCGFRRKSNEGRGRGAGDLRRGMVDRLRSRRTTGTGAYVGESGVVGSSLRGVGPDGDVSLLNRGQDQDPAVSYHLSRADLRSVNVRHTETLHGSEESRRQRSRPFSLIVTDPSSVSKFLM